MKKIKVGINGFGRIGRLVARVMSQRERFEIVAINDIIDTSSPKTYEAGVKMMANLFKWDSAHKQFPGEVMAQEDKIVVNGHAIKVVSSKVPAEIPWGSELDFVVESTGVFRKRNQIQGHLQTGKVKRVLLSVPPKDQIDAVVVKGVNDSILKKEHTIISNASCTTNCLAPLVKVLNDSFGLNHGLMTTVHAYTMDQKLLDSIHKSDARRARSAAANIVPTTTGAAKTIGKIIPELDGRLDGMAIRVPVVDGSLVDLVVQLDKLSGNRDYMVQAVNDAMKQAAEGALKGILQYSEEPLVSSDIVGNSHSSIFDAMSTLALSETGMVKVVSWYDNEWGYSNRCVDIMEHMVDLDG